MPAVSEPSLPAHLASAGGPAGVQLLRRPARSWSASPPGSPSDPRSARGSRVFQQVTVFLLAGLAGAGGRLGADALPGHGRRRSGSRSSTATATTPTSGPRCWPCTCRRARRSRPSTWPTAPAGQALAHPVGRRRPRAVAVRQLRMLLGPHRRRTHSSVRIPQETDTSSPGSPAGARVTRSRPERNASGGAVIGSTANACRGACPVRRRRCRPSATGGADRPTARRRDRSPGRAPRPWRPPARHGAGRRTRRRDAGRAAAGRPGSRRPCPVDRLLARPGSAARRRAAGWTPAE